MPNHVMNKCNYFYFSVVSQHFDLHDSQGHLSDSSRTLVVTSLFHCASLCSENSLCIFFSVNEVLLPVLQCQVMTSADSGDVLLNDANWITYRKRVSTT